ncbi:hypothetical protein LTS15_006582 [Exophiala xenobiotica]|nr:hypothetical protein LTS15_006582 [Exophiala xenobiotica]
MSASMTGFQGSLSLSEQPSLRPHQMTSSLPLYLSTAQTKPLPRVKLASFERCSCDRLDGGQAHLSVHTHETELPDAKGVAISYTWGAFDREKRCIGHKRDSPDEAVEMELGSEWRVSSVQERLAQLTEQHEGCWVDQICMPQKEEKTREKEEKIRQTLDAIPSIFSTLPVTVLLPGSLCGCLRIAFNGYQAAKREADEQQASADQPSEASARLDRCMERLERALYGTECLNSNGASGRQEPEHLNDYSQRLYEERAKSLGLSPRQGVDILLDENAFAIAGLVSTMSNEVPLPATLPQSLDDLTSTNMMGDAVDFPAMLKVASMLLGETQMGDGAARKARGPNPSLLLSLSILADCPRTATKAEDYILSIFPAMEGYSIPENFKHLSPTELLKNTLAQLHNLENWFTPSYSPAGLCGNISPFCTMVS